jgi:hypothetical protein
MEQKVVEDMNMKKVIKKVPVIRVQITVSPHIWGETVEI